MSSEPDLSDNYPADPTKMIHWVLECGCEPMIEHCAQCDHRREVRAMVDMERAVEKACQAIYMEFEGYWPSDLERRRIAVALVAR